MAPETKDDLSYAPTETLVNQLLLSHVNTIRDLSVACKANSLAVKELRGDHDALCSRVEEVAASKMDRPWILGVIRENFWKAVASTLALGAIAKVATLIDKWRGP